MTLCITEKRDVAKKIASYLGATKDQGDWFEGNGYQITWCRGHLLELRVEEADGTWSLGKLPILPARFSLGPISKGKDKEGNYVNDPGVVHRLAVIKDLSQGCDEIVNCADAGREGQLIFDNVSRYLKFGRPCKRLWTSSLTKKDIVEAFRNLPYNSEFEEIGIAARLRSEADWMVGINATRAFTLTANASKPLSLGRVQTPTLCIICQRYLENKNFKSEPFWYIAGETSKDGVPIKYRSDENYSIEEQGQWHYKRVVEDGKLVVESVKTERKNEDAPLLHDLASLQKLANSKYSLTAKQTLDAAQSLYEKQLISYPRTSSRYISENVFRELRDTIEQLTSDKKYGAAAERLLEGSLNKRSVDETRLTDHHGLIILGVQQGDLSVIESQVYELVLIRFLEALSPVCVVDATTVEMSAGEDSFTIHGRKEIYPGWRGVCRGEDFSDEAGEENIENIEVSMQPLPQMSEGDTLELGRVDLVRDMTKPRPLLTDGTLLTQMENAGKRISDKKLAKNLKGIGIGTAATRDAIIDEIINRGYVVREKRKLVPTELGLSVYNVVKDKEIANVEMTALWESSLNAIADCDEQEKESFPQGIREYTIKITDDIRTADDIRRLGKLVEAQTIKCPKCKNDIPIGEKGGRCSCGYAAWRLISGKALTIEQMRQLYEKGKTEVISGFKSREGKSFSAALVLGEEGLSFEFPKMAEEDKPDCPKCGGKMSFSQKSCWCPQCRYTVWRNIAGKALTDGQLKTLIANGRTSKLSGFKSKTGRSFEAALVLGEGGEVKFEFNK